MAEHQCVDCKADPPATVRKLATTTLGEAPRCATHLREVKLRRKKRARAQQVERTYGISEADNHALYLLQGGLCWLCRKATGATKSLAVDHDHATDEVRGRLCGPCNQFIGRLSDDPEAARRLVAYLSGDTPYRRLKAQQVLEVAFGCPVTVLQVLESGAVLLADWKPDPDPGVLSCRTLVRTADGVWQVIP